MSKKIFVNKRILVFLAIFISGFFLFIYGLGSTGLVDETPPLFASAGRTMSQSGDWLTPKVNGILRFDKPPLFYWLMAAIYSIPGNQIWDNLGSLSARLPSALSALFLMLMIADTLFCFTEDSNNKIYLSLVSALCFASSQLIIIWSKTAVSDSLLCGTMGISLLGFWRRMSINTNNLCIMPWFFLALAILTKGPVALVITFLTLTLFLFTQKNAQILISKINPYIGFLITLFISIPWYLIQFVKQGNTFLDNFFGYHNLQRYTSVVNNHSEPWWFFLYIMLLASLPLSIFLIHGIWETSKDLIIGLRSKSNDSESLYIFSLCWLLSVFLFFSISATKLPSYWLPAVPAASLLIVRSTKRLINQKKLSIVWLFTTFILLGLTFAFYFSDKWLVLINDPEMPNLASDIEAFGLISKARVFMSLLTLSAIIFLFRFKPKAMLYLQILFLSGQFLLMNPIRRMADTYRQLPLRAISKRIINTRIGNEPLAMIGIRKPSLHFYSKQIVFYESNSPSGMVNLSERFNYGRRSNELDNPDYDSDTFLVVIDKYSKNEVHWSNIKHNKLDVKGIYSLIRINKEDLNLYADNFKKEGIKSNWRFKKYEKF